MKYPKFFEKVETITFKDSLSEFLGTFDDGIITYTYLDVVMSAGHSCPTVAGAYLTCLKGIQYLHQDEFPNRGNIKVQFKNNLTEGVTGVISNVITQITGATLESGFKGIGGNFIRHSLMEFNADIKGDIRFSRVDNNKYIDIIYTPFVHPDPEQNELFQKSLSGEASPEEKKRFGILWQERVEKILIEFKDDPRLIEFIEPE